MPTIRLTQNDKEYAIVGAIAPVLISLMTKVVVPSIVSGSATTAIETGMPATSIVEVAITPLSTR